MTAFLSEELRVLNQFELQADLVATLRETEHHSHLVPRVAECHRSFSHHFDRDCGAHFALPANSCGCRLCPHDQRRRSLKVGHRFQKFLMGKKNLKYAVLSERNSEDLAGGIRSLFAAWDRFRKSGLWSSRVDGAIVVLEVTYNREEDTWHPHLNVLLQGDYIPFDELLAAWERSTKQNGHAVWIKKADEGTVRELVKYVTKLTDLVGMPIATDKFLTATARRRFIRTYGTFYRIPIDEEEGKLCCPDCGSTNVIRLGSLWAWQVSLDFEGNFRVATIPFSGAPPAMFDRGG